MLSTRAVRVMAAKGNCRAIFAIVDFLVTQTRDETLGLFEFEGQATCMNVIIGNPCRRSACYHVAER